MLKCHNDKGGSTRIISTQSDNAAHELRNSIVRLLFENMAVVGWWLVGREPSRDGTARLAGGRTNHVPAIRVAASS
jgi:hypothetical protein